MSYLLVTPSESYLSFLPSFMLSSLFLIPCLAMYDIEAKFDVMHEVRDHQWAQIKAKFCVVGVLQGCC